MRKFSICLVAVLIAGLFAPSLSCAQQVQIVAPADGSVVAPGQKVVVRYEADPFVGPVTLYASSDYVEIYPGEKRSFILDLPPDMPSGRCTLTLEADNGDFSRITINVEIAAAPKSIRIDPDGLLFDKTGQKRYLKVTGFLPNGTEKDLTRSFNTRYSSTHPDIATVSDKGEVQAKKPGEAAISAAYAGLSFSIKVRVAEENGDVPEAPPSPVSTPSRNNSLDREWPDQPKNICRLAGAGMGFDGCPYPVWRGNSFDSYDLNTGYSFRALDDTRYWGVRLDPGVARVPIHAFDKCYYVDNRSDKAFFVPIKTSMEWMSFLKALPSGVSVRACTVHGVYTSSSATSRGDRAVFSLPAYAQTGEAVTLSQTFGYYEPRLCDRFNKCSGPWEWRETIHARFRPVPPYWKAIDEFVTGEPPVIPEGHH